MGDSRRRRERAEAAVARARLAHAAGDREQTIVELREAFRTWPPMKVATELERAWHEQGAPIEEGAHR